MVLQITEYKSYNRDLIGSNLLHPKCVKLMTYSDTGEFDELANPSGEMGQP